MIKPPQGRGSLTWEGALLHMPVGMLSAGLLHFWPLHALVLAIVFICYEIVEDISEKDRAYRDLFGFLIGFTLVTVIQVAYELFMWLKFSPGAVY